MLGRRRDSKRDPYEAQDAERNRNDILLDVTRGLSKRIEALEEKVQRREDRSVYGHLHDAEQSIADALDLLKNETAKRLR